MKAKSIGTPSNKNQQKPVNLNLALAKQETAQVEQGSIVIVPAPTDFGKLIKQTPFAKFSGKKLELADLANLPEIPKKTPLKNLPLTRCNSSVVTMICVQSEPSSPVSAGDLINQEKSYDSLKTAGSDKNTPRSILKRGGKSRFSFHPSQKKSKYKRQQSSTQNRVKIVEGFFN